MRDGSYKSALEIQNEILLHATAWVDKLQTDPLGGDCKDILVLWGNVLAKLKSDPDSLADTIDWIAKRRILDAMRKRDDLPYDHPRLKAIDFQYHEMSASRGLFPKLGCLTICEKNDVVRAMSEPPINTRAFFRGKCISTWPQSVTSANWDSVVFDTGEPTLQRIPMMDPLKGTERHVGHLFEECSSVRELLLRLGDDVEEVVDDPGW
jgi:proteasome accessory factor A